MTIADVFTDCYGRIRDRFARAVKGLTPEELAWRPGPDANSIGWLLWHLTRVQDDHIAGRAGRGEVWTTEGFFERFALPFTPDATGYAHTSEEVEACRIPSAELLLEYHEAVHAATVGWISKLDDAAFDQEIDRWRGEPVTLAVRLVSVFDDNIEHVGQAAYLRGMLGK